MIMLLLLCRVRLTVGSGDVSGPWEWGLTLISRGLRQDSGEGGLVR